jgi:hypothetical protein
LIYKICDFCKKQYLTSFTKSKYCSKVCAKNFWKQEKINNPQMFIERNKIYQQNRENKYRIQGKRILKDLIYVCSVCDKKYKPKVYNSKVCSKKCKNLSEIWKLHVLMKKEEFRNKKNCIWNIQYSKRMGYQPVKEIECIICKNKFIRQSIDQTWCSKECRIQYLRNKANERYHKNKEQIMLKRKNNVEYCILNKLRMRINCAVKSQGAHKSKKTMQLVGCTVKELKQYLEQKFKEGMSWYNYGKHGWHIDHIKPCSSFNLKKGNEQHKCFHYTNLQPLWAKENLQKSNKVILVEN